MGSHKYYSEMLRKWEEKKESEAKIDNLHSQKHLIYSAPDSYTVTDSSSGAVLLTTGDRDAALTCFLKIG